MALKYTNLNSGNLPVRIPEAQRLPKQRQKFRSLQTLWPSTYTSPTA